MPAVVRNFLTDMGPDCNTTPPVDNMSIIVLTVHFNPAVKENKSKLLEQKWTRPDQSNPFICLQPDIWQLDKKQAGSWRCTT